MKEILLKRRQNEREERIRRILGAAREVFFQKGYTGTNIRNIARKAVLSPGTIYYYFSGIDEIYVEIAEESFKIIQNFLKEGLAQYESSLGKLDHMGREFLKYYLKYPEYTELFVFSNIGWRRVGLKQDLIQRLDKVLNETLSILHEVISEGMESGEINNDRDSWELCHALWASIEGTLCLDRRGLLENARFSIDELIETQLGIIFNGIRSRQ